MLEHPLQLWEDCARTYHAEWEGFEFRALRQDLNPGDDWEENGVSGGLEDDSPMWYEGRAFVLPERQQACVKKLHEDKLGGHPGIRKTLKRV